LPIAELLEERALFLHRHLRFAARLPPLIDEPRKYQAQFVDARSLGNLQIALQPLLGWWISTPAREFSSEIDLMPFRVMARREQRFRPCVICRARSLAVRWSV